MKSKILIRLGNFFFYYRDFLFPVIFLGLLLFSKPIFPCGRYDLSVWLVIGGFFVAMAGQILRALTVGYDYIVRGGVNKKVYADRLVTGGVFSHSRNPLYLGNFIILVGLSLIVNAHLIYWIGIPLFFLIYASLIAAEENFLRQKFGSEYEDYCQRVNRIWPNWKGFKTSIQNMNFSWKRLLNKEYGSFCMWIIVAILMRMWSLHCVLGKEAAMEIKRLAFILILPISIYILIPVLKDRKSISE